MAAMAAFTFSSCEDVPEPYTLPTQPGAPTTAEAKGTGTAADPFNIAGIIKYIEDGGSADQEVYTKGKVVSVKAGSFDATYGSLKYYISDDGTTNNQFYVYNGYAGPNRTKFSGEDALKPGDEVVICGKAKTSMAPKSMTRATILYLSMVNQQVGLQPLILQPMVTSMRHSARASVHSQPRPLRVQHGLSTLTATQRLQVTIIPLRQQLHLKATLFLRLSTSLHLKARHWVLLHSPLCYKKWCSR